MNQLIKKYIKQEHHLQMFLLPYLDQISSIKPTLPTVSTKRFKVEDIRRLTMKVGMSSGVKNNLFLNIISVD